MKKYSLVIVLSFLVVLGGVFAYISSKAEAATTGPAVNAGISVSRVSRIAAWTAVLGVIDYRVKVYEGSSLNPILVKENITSTSYDFTDSITDSSKVYYYTIEARNGIGYSKASAKTVLALTYLPAKAEVALTTPNQALDPRYDFTSIDSNIKAMEGMMKVLTTAKNTELKNAKTANEAYYKAYLTARNAALALQKVNNTLNATNLAKAITDLSAKEEALKGSITKFDAKFKAIDSMVPIGRGQRELISGATNDSISIDPLLGLITINNKTGEDSSLVFGPIGRRCSCVSNPVCCPPKTSNSGTVSINLDGTITINSALNISILDTDPVLLPYKTYCVGSTALLMAKCLAQVAIENTH
ncbi:MAG: hypothetical protein WAV10_03305 [Minisyncoccia bacterium]